MIFVLIYDTGSYESIVISKAVELTGFNSIVGGEETLNELIRCSKSSIKIMITALKTNSKDPFANCERFKNAYPNAKVIGVTTSKSVNFHANAYESGFDRILVNPTYLDIINTLKLVNENVKKRSINKKKSGLRKLIMSDFQKLGVTQKYKGLRYVVDAIILTITGEIGNGTSMVKVTKDIYPSLASLYKTTSTNVEHDMRTVVKAINITKNNIDLAKSIFTFCDEKDLLENGIKITNANLISSLISYYDV